MQHSYFSGCGSASPWCWRGRSYMAWSAAVEQPLLEGGLAWPLRGAALGRGRGAGHGGYNAGEGGFKLGVDWWAEPFSFTKSTPIANRRIQPRAARRALKRRIESPGRSLPT